MSLRTLGAATSHSSASYQLKQLMELIRYKPGEAIRWLETGAQDMRKQAKRQTSKVLSKQGPRDVPDDLKSVAGALYGYGKSALADLMHRQLEASEYILHADRIEVVGSGSTKIVLFDDVHAMRLKGERCTVVHERGKFIIKPHAHIVSGTLKVPIGWVRNGMEVPYETLLDELSARAGVNIEHA